MEEDNKKVYIVTSIEQVRYATGNVKRKVGKKKEKKEVPFSVEKDFTTEFLIRKLRNAISHGSVDISDNMNFTFSDSDGTVVRFTIGDLQQFVQMFRRYYITGE